jgi:hypothetical protein
MINYVLLIINILFILFIIYIKFTNVSKNNYRETFNDTQLFFINILNYVSNENIREHNIDDNYIVPDVTLKYSNKINSRGIFANKNYKKDDIIEICPCIKISDMKKPDKPINDYVFKLNDQHCVIAFGYCSLYNHSDTPNATWTIVNENQMQITVLSDIEKNEEIYMSYGSDYWSTRKNKVQVNKEINLSHHNFFWNSTKINYI